METNIIYIKNMVCNRCIMVVRELFRPLGVEPVKMELGRVTLAMPLSPSQESDLRAALEVLGFEIIDDRRSCIVERVKNAIVDLVHHGDGVLKANLSDFIAGRTDHEYGYVSHLFSESENTTIEKYYIAQRIERVKELLEYGEMSLNEIADSLGYSSAAHLSAQFKKITGITASSFRQDKKKNSRRPLDEV